MEPAIAGFGAVGQGLARMFARKGVEVVVVAAQTATRGSRAAGEAGAELFEESDQEAEDPALTCHRARSDQSPGD